jgi:transmembrane sensor
MTDERPTTRPSDERPLLHGVDWAVRAGVAEEVMLGARREVRRRRQKRLAVGGAAAAVVLGALVWFAPAPRQAAPMVPSSAVVNVPARQTLPDGSTVDLKEGAEITLAYTNAVRRVMLVHGEAHFEVVPNKARPFVVAVDGLEVRAVGTAFSVRRGAAEVKVLVATGRVAVDRVVTDNASQPVAAQTVAMLDAGHETRVEVTPSPSATAPVVEAISAADLQERLAWRVPRLEFTRTPLVEAIPMINQHSAIKLSLADPSLGEMRISGLLRVDNVESLLRLLEVEHGIKAEHGEAGVVVLRPGR